VPEEGGNKKKKRKKINKSFNGERAGASSCEDNE